MKSGIVSFFLVLCLLPGVLLGQLGLPAVVTSAGPDFGATLGNWGHLQFARPFGLQGIVLEEWQDLLVIHPVNGEYLNTNRQGWLPLAEDLSVWAQMHPELTAPSDTVAPSLLVNYKQGDGAFKDFTAWYHNSLGPVTRYAWVTKLRSHPRYINVTEYDEQQHRFQLKSETETQLVKVEMNYNHQVNPMYVSEFDTATQIWNYQEDQRLRSDQWEGYFHWQNKDSSGSGSQVFAQVQGGVWEWSAGKYNSFNSLAYLSHGIGVGDYGPLELKAGVVSKQLGGHKSTRHFLEFNLPPMGWGNLTADVGLKNLGVWRFLPKIKVNYENGPVQLNYLTRHLVDDPTWQADINTALIHHFQAKISSSKAGLAAGAWHGDKSGQAVSGYEGETWLVLPWNMDLKVGVSVLDQTPDWVWTKKQLSWEINQDFTLFDQALYGHLKVWGRHLDQPQVGFLDPDIIKISPAVIPTGPSALHLLNYTIQAQVSTLIIGFTDTNILQDPLWSSYVDVSWESEFTLMTNQFPENRFRYLSVIWVFDN